MANFANISKSQLSWKQTHIAGHDCMILVQTRPTKIFLSHQERMMFSQRKTTKMLSASLNIGQEAELEDS